MAIILSFLVFCAQSQAFADGEFRRGPIAFQEASDKQLDGLRSLDIQSSFKDINIYPEQKERKQGYKGWVIASNLSEQTLVKIPSQMKELPAPYTFVGRDKCHFVRMIRSPLPALEPGDVLVYFEPDTKQVSSSLYRNMVQGKGHVSVVTRDSAGALQHIDSPQSWSGKDFSKKSYHILRLRPYPKEITSQEELDRWLSDPEKRKKLKDFLTERNYRIAAINFYTNRLYENNYGYAFDGDPLVLTQKERLRYVLEQGSSFKASFYCSDFAYTPLALAGVTRPASRGVSETLHALHAFIEKTASQEKISKEQAIKNGMKNLASEYAGTSGPILKIIMKLMSPKKSLTTDGQKAIQEILSSPPDVAEQKLKMAPEKVRRWFSDKTIGPADFFNEIYNTESDYFYAGTYVHTKLDETRTKSTQSGEKDRSVGQCE